MKKWILGVLILGALALTGGLLMYYFVYNKPHTNYEKAKAEYSLDAEQLYNEFIQNQDVAQEKYNGKVLSIEGVLSDIEQNEAMLILVFAFQDGLFGPEGLRVTMLPTHHEQALNLKAGDTVRLKGYCTGFTGSDVILEHGSIQ